MTNAKSTKTRDDVRRSQNRLRPPKHMKSNEKTKNTMLSEQLQSQISKWKNEAKLVPLSHKYMTVHFTGFNALQ
jgi:hypothetical protein